ncbi:hypothetical protein ACQKMD_16555 [Viridibacillus sp. NPDC096237]|uniref:hypothetical protein n=1 Tax=Viridibacillus sp. NPDC096237 TaxID=3390721 RepID=UPI003D040248
MIKLQKILLIGVILLAIPLFWINYLMTPNPGSPSGNGNPAIIVVVILLIFLFCLIYLWLRLFNQYRLKLKVLVVSIFITITHLVIAYLYQKRSFIKYRKFLADVYEKKFKFVDWEYIDHITSFMSIHVNNQFFNANTYFMYISISLLAALILYEMNRLLRSKS